MMQHNKELTWKLLLLQIRILQLHVAICMRIMEVVAGDIRELENRLLITDMRRLTTGVRSEKCVARRFRRCANAIECTYTHLDSIAYYTPRLYGTAYFS